MQRAIALAPGLAPSHRWYAIYLAAMGRVSEAMKEAQRVEELDPLSITAHDGVAVVSASAGQYDRCIEEGRKIIELDPDDLRAYGDMAVGHMEKGMYQEALQDTEKGITVSHSWRNFRPSASKVLFPPRCSLQPPLSEWASGKRQSKLWRQDTSFTMRTWLVSTRRPGLSHCAPTRGFKTCSGA